MAKPRDKTRIAPMSVQVVPAGVECVSVGRQHRCGHIGATKFNLSTKLQKKKLINFKKISKKVPNVCADCR